MFQSQPVRNYTEIFNQRGELYHRAMMAQPNARRAEFERIVQLSDLQSGQLIADMPSGGGYLRAFIPDDVRLVAVETASPFLQQNDLPRNQKLAEEQGGAPEWNRDFSSDSQLLCSDLSQIPLPDKTFDRVLSLAGAHHLPDLDKFCREVRRLLKPGGTFVLADVLENSRAAQYLNQWVDAHNSMGHQGIFLNQFTPEAVENCGFEINFAAPKAYHWEFDSEAEMISYCRSLFGLDLADDAQILEGLQTVLGVEKYGACCRMNWELMFISATKTASN